MIGQTDFEERRRSRVLVHRVQTGGPSPFSVKGPVSGSKGASNIEYMDQAGCTVHSIAFGQKLRWYRYACFFRSVWVGISTSFDESLRGFYVLWECYSHFACSVSSFGRSRLTFR